MRPNITRTNALHASVHSCVHLPSLAGESSPSNGATSFLNSGTNPLHHNRRPNNCYSYFKDLGGDIVVHFCRNFAANLYPWSIN